MVMTLLLWKNSYFKAVIFSSSDAKCHLRYYHYFVSLVIVVRKF